MSARVLREPRGSAARQNQQLPLVDTPADFSRKVARLGCTTRCSHESRRRALARQIAGGASREGVKSDPGQA